MEYNFSWLKDNGGRTSVRVRTLKDVVDEYLDYRIGKVRPSTINRDRISLNQLMRVIHDNTPINHITYNHIEGNKGFIRIMLDNGYAVTGLNISLRHIKTFFNWCYKKARYFKEEVHFDMLNEGRPLPRYLNEYELNQIYSLDWLDGFYKRAFYFYEHTGCRPSEPFCGELMGDWLFVDAEDSKSRAPRQIKLTEELKLILVEMQACRDMYTTNGSAKPNEAVYYRISKEMRKVVKSLRFSNKKRISLKSFRHTYGIKRITVTGNIYQVSRELGHSKTTTTEIYLEYPEQRRLDDFPSLSKYIKRYDILEENRIKDTVYKDTGKYNFLYSPREIDNL
jgi:integrase